MEERKERKRDTQEAFVVAENGVAFHDAERRTQLGARCRQNASPSASKT